MTGLELPRNFLLLLHQKLFTATDAAGSQSMAFMLCKRQTLHAVDTLLIVDHMVAVLTGTHISLSTCVLGVVLLVSITEESRHYGPASFKQLASPRSTVAWPKS